MSGVGDGRYSGENKQTDSCEKKSSEGKKVVVVQPPDHQTRMNMRKIDV